MITNDHEDMHAGELETSLLLHACPDLVRDGYQDADHTANERPGLLTTGMQGYTTSGIIGRPSLATAPKGRAALASLVQSFAACLQLLGEARPSGGQAEGPSNTHSTRLGPWCGENFLYVFKGARSAPRAVRRVIAQDRAPRQAKQRMARSAGRAQSARGTLTATGLAAPP
jgi:hypothetical protein